LLLRSSKETLTSVKSVFDSFGATSVKENRVAGYKLSALHLKAKLLLWPITAHLSGHRSQSQRKADVCSRSVAREDRGLSLDKMNGNESTNN